jgi:multidrug efflux pump subunit AcrB
MFIIPFVVTLALLISSARSLLDDAGAHRRHQAASRPPSRLQVWRNRFNRRIRLRYGQALAYTLRRPKRFAALTLARWWPPRRWWPAA